MLYFNLFLIAFMSASILFGIMFIGKERKPLTPGAITINTLINCLIIAGIVYFNLM